MLDYVSLLNPTTYIYKKFLVKILLTVKENVNTATVNRFLPRNIISGKNDRKMYNLPVEFSKCPQLGSD